MVRALNPDLRQLIEAIEAWPTVVSHAQRAAQKPNARGAAAAPVQGGAPYPEDAEEGEEVEEARRAVAPAPVPRLSSSLRAPASRRLSSMASTVPQRDQSWRRSAIGPGLGPGAYDTRPGGVEVRDAVRHTDVFRSNVPQRPDNLGRAGEVVPESMYAHSCKPHKPKAILGVSPFNSTTLRFGVDGHLQAVRVQQRPTPRRRTTSRYQGAPKWDAPYSEPQPPPLEVPLDHEERLAAARALLAQH